jgi:hypothetical protein
VGGEGGGAAPLCRLAAFLLFVPARFPGCNWFRCICACVWVCTSTSVWRLASEAKGRLPSPLAGSFPIRETEWYFGLRIRHKHQRSRYMNIPVNVTVGPYGGCTGVMKHGTAHPVTVVHGHLTVKQSL